MTTFVVYNTEQKIIQNNTEQKIIQNNTEQKNIRNNDEQKIIQNNDNTNINNCILLKSEYDVRDHIYIPNLIQSKTTSIDLRSLCSEIEQQSNLGSCTGNALAGIAEFLNKKKKINIEVSRLFIYYNERILSNTINSDSGATIRDGIKACNRWGFCSEKLCPYIINDFTKKPTEEAYLDGSKHKAVSYKSILNFNDMKKALIDKNPVIIGFNMYSSFNKINKTGIMSYPSKNETYEGGHAVLIVGFDDNYLNKNKGYFICRNSWGVNWGDKGYFYMPYDVIKDSKMSFDFWIITLIT